MTHNNPLDTCGSWFEARKLIYLINQIAERRRKLRRERLRMFFARHWFPNGESDCAYKHGRFCGIPTTEKFYFTLSPEAREILNDSDKSDTTIWENEFDRFVEFMATDQKGRGMPMDTWHVGWLNGRWKRMNEGEVSHYMSVPDELYEFRNLCISQDLVKLRRAAKIALKNNSDPIFVSSEIAQQLEN